MRDYIVGDDIIIFDGQEYRFDILVMMCGLHKDSFIGWNKDEVQDYFNHFVKTKG